MWDTVKQDNKSSAVIEPSHQANGGTLNSQKFTSCYTNLLDTLQSVRTVFNALDFNELDKAETACTKRLNQIQILKLSGNKLLVGDTCRTGISLLLFFNFLI